MGNGATSGAGGAGGPQAVTTSAGAANNQGSATGNSSANSGEQINGITQSGQCASNGVNVNGFNSGVVNNGRGNKVVNNSGEVLGVLIQNLGGRGGSKDGLLTRDGRGGGSSSPVTTINAVGNTGNSNGQAVVGGGKKGSTPNQNSTQTFIITP